MPYILTCDCGQQMTVAENQVGTVGRCVNCARKIHIDRKRLLAYPNMDEAQDHKGMTIPMDSSQRARVREEMNSMTGEQFEYFVARLLSCKGFQNVELVGRAGDKGVDIVAEMNGINKYAIQCKKRASGRIDRSAVSDAVGGIDVYGCNAAMVVTNSEFREGAIETADAQLRPCQLADGAKLLQWIEELPAQTRSLLLPSAFDIGEQEHSGHIPASHALSESRYIPERIGGGGAVITLLITLVLGVSIVYMLYDLTANPLQPSPPPPVRNVAKPPQSSPPPPVRNVAKPPQSRAERSVSEPPIIPESKPPILGETAVHLIHVMAGAVGYYYQAQVTNSMAVPLKVCTEMKLFDANETELYSRSSWSRTVEPNTTTTIRQNGVCGYSVWEQHVSHKVLIVDYVEAGSFADSVI